MKYIRFILLGAVLGLSACATNYYSYSGSPVLVGHGGASRKVGGVDLWVMGTPPWRYRVVGYIEDSRPGGPIPMAMRDGQLAARVRAQGGDGLILNSDQADYVGTFTVANASANTSGTTNFVGNTAYFSGNTNAFGTATSLPLFRRNSRYFVIKYMN